MKKTVVRVGKGGREVVECSAEEESEILAEWAANDPAKPENQRPNMVVSPWQIRKALNLLGLRSQVEQALEAAEQDIKDGWNYATEFRRLDPRVIQIGEALGKTPEEIDEVFKLAMTL